MMSRPYAEVSSVTGYLVIEASRFCLGEMKRRGWADESRFSTGGGT
jgi:hypothetical protein